MNPFKVTAIMLRTVLMTAFGMRRMNIARFLETPSGSPKDNQSLRTEVEELQERIRVLERIATDRGVETAAQIEALRDKERVGGMGRG